CGGKSLLYVIIEVDSNLFGRLVDEGMISGGMVSPLIKRMCFENNKKCIKYLMGSMPGIFLEGGKMILLECVEQCLAGGSDMLEDLLTRDVFDEMSRNPKIMDSLIDSAVGLKAMFEHKLITMEILERDNCRFVFRVSSPGYLKEIVDLFVDGGRSEKLLVGNCEFQGRNMLHHCSMHPSLVKYFVSKLDVRGVFGGGVRYVDVNGKTFLDYLVENGYYDDLADVLDIFIGSKIDLSKWLVNQDMLGRNLVMKFCVLQREIIELLLVVGRWIGRDLLVQYDFSRCTTLMYLVRYVGFNDLREFVDIRSVGEYLLWRDFNGDSVVTFAARYNEKFLEGLLGIYKIEELGGDGILERCFVIGCRYNHSVIRLLRDRVNLRKCVDVIDYGGVLCVSNFLQIAARYNSDSFKELIGSSLNLQEYVENVYVNALDEKEVINFNVLKVGIVYQPKVVSLLLDSKYGSEKLLRDTDLITKRGCVRLALEKQISSYVRIKKSKFFQVNMEGSDEMIVPRTDHYEMLMKHHDVVATDTLDCCAICYSNRNKIVFSPCWHKCCIACSTKLANCPQCRKEIATKAVYA
ncbi:MAG: ankyrin and ring finger domain protein, partial [Hyperionvirus sp.]